jgi:hypothetical protein
MQSAKAFGNAQVEFTDSEMRNDEAWFRPCIAMSFWRCCKVCRIFRPVIRERTTVGNPPVRLDFRNEFFGRDTAGGSPRQSVTG